MEKIMNAKNEWNQMVEGPIEGLTDEEVVEAMNQMKLEMAARPLEANMDKIIRESLFFFGDYDTQTKNLQEKYTKGKL